MVNLVLLAENRLSLPTDNRVTPLRIGFLVQFLLIGAWTLTFVRAPFPASTQALAMLGVFGGLHLAVVATFTVTESLAVSRRVQLQLSAASPRGWLLTIFRPGGGRGALYVLVQMVVLLFVAWRLDPTPANLRWFLALCGYICFFTGVPTIVFRAANPAGAASLQLRVAVLVLLPLAMLLPDIIHYVVTQPEVLSLTFSGRHVINPFRALANWPTVEASGWFVFPLSLGAIGLLCYLALISLGTRVSAQPALDADDPEEAAGDPGRVKAID